MAQVKWEVETLAFRASLPAAVEEYRLSGIEYIVLVGDKVVVLAKGFAPKRSGGLAASIHATAPVLTRQGAELEVIAGEGEREAIYMEYGTYKDRPHPYLRPALAIAAGAARGGAFAVSTSTSTRARLFARRSRARIAVQRQQRRGLRLTPAEARLVGQSISQQLRYRGPKVTYRRPRPNA